MVDTELNKTPLKTKFKWAKEASVCVQFWLQHYYKKAVNIFERIEISETIHGGAVESYFKKTTRSDTTHDFHIRHTRWI